MLAAATPARRLGDAADSRQRSGGRGDRQFGNLYVAEAYGNRFPSKYSATGTQLMAVGTTGSGQAQFNSPNGIAVESGGAIFVADTGNNRIQRFYPNGSYQTEWGTFGTALGQFKQPAAVAVDGGGNVCIADTDNNRVVGATPGAGAVRLLNSPPSAVASPLGWPPTGRQRLCLDSGK